MQNGARPNITRSILIKMHGKTTIKITRSVILMLEDIQYEATLE
jgi:hypothetical protein